MMSEFNDWWNDDDMLKENPYNQDTPIWWAYEGWCAAKRMEMRKAHMCKTAVPKKE